MTGVSAEDSLGETTSRSTPSATSSFMSSICCPESSLTDLMIRVMSCLSIASIRSSLLISSRHRSSEHCDTPITYSLSRRQAATEKRITAKAIMRRDFMWLWLLVSAIIVLFLFFVNTLQGLQGHNETFVTIFEKNLLTRICHRKITL